MGAMHKMVSWLIQFRNNQKRIICDQWRTQKFSMGSVRNTVQSGVRKAPLISKGSTDQGGDAALSPHGISIPSDFDDTAGVLIQRMDMIHVLKGVLIQRMEVVEVLN
ncbi:hypothetical protein J6590_095922 [Homalodisca vitripennis]|nr:hypothetical protein J6590_095922 [Homalodisca vitripennis]